VSAKKLPITSDGHQEGVRSRDVTSACQQLGTLLFGRSPSSLATVLHSFKFYNSFKSRQQPDLLIEFAVDPEQFRWFSQIALDSLVRSVFWI
jgi:hypothetical protein